MAFSFIACRYQRNTQACRKRIVPLLNRNRYKYVLLERNVVKLAFPLRRGCMNGNVLRLIIRRKPDIDM
jgi:hypothetical protein